MGKCEGYLLLSDLDGTLLSRDGTISARNREAIAAFVAEGGRFGIATGRAHYSTTSLTRGLAINSPIVVFNGSGVYDTHAGVFLHTDCFSLARLRGVVDDTMAAFPDIEVLLFESERVAMLTDCFWTANMPAQERPYFQRVQIEAVGDVIFKVVFTGTVELVGQVRAYLERHPFRREVDMMLASDSCLELLPRGVTKGSGLAMLARRLGIAPERTMAIGDYENDTEMLRVAGIAAAPANAMEEIRALADLVVAHHQADAVADFLEKVFA